jgi:hypothetical protein
MPAPHIKNPLRVIVLPVIFSSLNPDIAPQLAVDQKESTL